MTNSPTDDQAVIALFDAADRAERVFGALGDYGGGTPQGDALFALSRALADALPVVVAIKGLAAVRAAVTAE